MKRNILIIGLGNMGLSHLTSLINDKYHYNIDIYDKIKKKKLKNIPKNKSISFLKKLPKNKNYSFAIIATGPEVRFKITNYILNNNIIEIILLEKFLFKNNFEFKRFDKMIKKKRSKIFVNLWGKEVFRKLNLNKIKNSKIELFVKLRKNNLLTNLIHFIYLVSLFNKNKKFKISLKKSSLIKSNKNKIYDELSGMISVISQKVKCFIFSTEENIFKISLSYSNKKINYVLKKNKLVSNINKKNIKFPLAKFFTSKFFNDFYFKKEMHLPTYKEVNFLSKRLLLIIEKYFKRKILIR